MGWRDGAVAVGRGLEERFDRLKFRAKRRFGRMGPVEVLPYRGYGTSRFLRVKGRVLEASGITRSAADDTARTNLRNMALRFASAEVPHARVRARFAGREGEAVADAEGFFDARIELAGPAPAREAWHAVEVELSWPRGAGAVGSVLVPPPTARFAVISDLDDTVVRSSVTSFSKMVRIALLNNAHTRLPFEGVASFYAALREGRGGEANPIFYVSNSPWNLYDLLEDFLDVHGLPAGPLFLRDWSPTTVRSGAAHKLQTVRDLLSCYPHLPFVLVGDSGEEDPEIYRRVVREHPGRIRAVYIRDVTTDQRDAAVRAIAREVALLGTEMLLVKDTNAAAEHAAREGLVFPRK